MPTIPIRWSDNTDELKRNLAQGLNQIEATRAGAEKLVQAFQGGKLAESANKWAAAINQIGGATKLTAAEQERANAIFDKYIEKQQALGKAVPDAVTALNDEIKAMMAAREAANDTGTSTNAAAAAFSALKGAIQSPAEAAKTFSSEFGAGVLEPLGEFGVVAVEAAAVAVVVGVGLVQLASHARETAAAIHDIYKVTGMSVPAVSNLKFAIESAGGSLDQINGALFQFEQRMENNSDKVDKGLQMIGLSLGQIRDMSADQRLLAISDALRSTGDETNKAAVAMDIFGKQGRDMLPLLLKPLDDLTAKSKELGLTMSTEDAAAAEDFELRLHSLKAQSDATWTALGRHVSLAGYFTLAYERMKLAVANVAYAFGSTVTAIVTLNQYLPALLSTLRGTVGELPQISGDAKKGVDNLKASVASSAAGLEPWRAAIAGADKTASELDASAKALIETEKKQAAQADKLREFYANLSSSVDTLSGAQIEAIQYYQAQGVSVSDIAKALGIYQHQVELVVGAEKQAAESAKLLTEAKKKQAEAFEQSLKPMSEGVLANLKAQNVAQDELAKIIAAGTETAAQQQLDAVDKWERDEKAKLDQRADNYSQAEAAIVAAAQARRDEIARLSELEDVKVKYEFVGPDKPAFNAITATFAQNVQHALSETWKGIPDTLVRSLEGGGGLKGAGQSIGAQLGHDVTSSWADSIEKQLPGKIGSALGSIIGPLGSLVGPLLSKLFSIGGPSKEELAGRDVEKKFQDQFSSFDDMMNKVGEAYRATGRSSEQAQADVKAMFDAEKQGADATAAAVKKINDVLQQQAAFAQDASDASSGIGGFLGIGTGAMDASTSDRAKLKDLTQQLNAATPGSSQYADLQKQIEAVNADLQTQAGILDATLVKTQDEATAMGASVVGSFNLAIEGGATFAEALKQSQPAIEALQKELDQAGLDGGEAFNLLSRQAALLKDPIAGPALTAVQDLAAGFKGLSASGQLTQTEFQGLGSQVKQTFDSLVAQGKNAPDIMVAMQGPLQELWQEEQQYHFQLDDATQALLDQAVASGEVGEKHKSTTEQMLDAENKLVDVMSAMATAMGVTLPASVQAGVAAATGPNGIGGLKSAINEIPTSKTFTLNVEQNGNVDLPSGSDFYPQPGPDDQSLQLAATGGEVAYGRVIPFARYMSFGGMVPERADYFAAGRLVQFVPRGTDTVPAMLTPRELVVNEIQQGTVGRTLESAQSLAQTVMDLAAVSAQQAASGSDASTMPPLRIQLMIGRQVFAETAIDSIRADDRGIRRVLKRVAGGG